MRFTFSLFCLVTFCLNQSLAQTCLPQGINFFTQATVDNFQANYPGCIFVEGDVTIGNGYPTDITNLTGLNTLKGIGGGFNMESQTLLANFNGLGNLDSIYGDVYFFDNNSLTSVDGLEMLKWIGGDVTFYNNLSLTNLNGLSSLERIEGEFEVAVQPLLTGFQGLENVSYLGQFDMGGNHLIPDFHGFEGLIEVGGNFGIQSGDALDSLAGLNNLESVGGIFGIGFYPEPQISSIDALSSLTTVGGLSIASLNVHDLNGLSSLTTVNGDFDISNCDSIVSLDGLQNLTTIEGYYFEINNNENLENLTGLDNAELLNIVQMNITYNPQLSNCAVSTLCNYLDGSPVATINIHNNAGGCSSIAEVEYACSFSGVTDFEELGLSLYPNPTNGRFRITSTGSDDLEFDRMDVYDSNGRLVHSIANSSLFDTDVQLNLIPGIYHLRIAGPDFHVGQRLVIN